MKIAIDAMGGDHGVIPNIQGSIQAAKELDIEVVLVGDQVVVRRELEKLHCVDPRISIQHASQTVDMHEPPAQVARRKRDSSIWVATNLVKSGEATAVVSAGHTGAAMVSAFFLLGAIKGVERPAIAAAVPTLTGQAVLLDVGATVDCTPQNLYQFALMGHEYGKHLFGKSNLSVGLLSIGEEDVKGNDVTKEALRLLRESSMNFIGNLEGRDVYSGVADVIVCDGFLGNVALKLSEGVADAMKKMFLREIAASRLGRMAFLLLATPLLRMKRLMDPAEFGGAPLLGVNGISVICHGRSSAKAIKNAILKAHSLAEGNIIELIQQDIEASLTLPPENNSTMAVE